MSFGEQPDDIEELRENYADTDGVRVDPNPREGDAVLVVTHPNGYGDHGVSFRPALSAGFVAAGVVHRHVEEPDTAASRVLLLRESELDDVTINAGDD